jgi:type II secretory pathway pseudopilin PulG
MPDRAGEGGYTVIEMLVVLVICTIVIGSLTAVFVAGSEAQLDANARFQAQDDTLVALDRLRRDIRCASSASPVTASSFTLVTPCNASGIKWCTNLVSTGRYSLHRLVGSGTCGATNAKYADWLTTSSLFAYETASTSKLARLRVNLPVKVSSMPKAYTLCHIIALRNSTRSGTAGTPVPAC